MNEQGVLYLGIKLLGEGREGRNCVTLGAELANRPRCTQRHHIQPLRSSDTQTLHFFFGVEGELQWRGFFRSFLGRMR